MIQHQVIGLLYTRTCPLACGHCITESSPQAKGRMRPEQVRRYLPAIRRFSRHVSFTGGEPLLYYREILALAAQAKQLGLEVSVVTGAGWVTGEAMARTRVRELVAAGISRMVISWDRYHEAFTPREHALTVARAACTAGIPVDVRTVVAANQNLEDYQAAFRGLPVRFESTSPLQLGAARHLPDTAFQWQDSPPKGLCNVVLRPVIEPDGTVYACCGPGHFSRRPSPLVLGNAEETPLDEILARGARDPILEAISLIGPHGLYRLLERRSKGGAPSPRRRYSGVCDLCLDLNGSRETVAALRQRLEENDAQILLAAAGMWAQGKSAATQAEGASLPTCRREVQSNGRYTQ
jgi:hypothetical protein